MTEQDKQYLIASMEGLLAQIRECDPGQIVCSISASRPVIPKTHYNQSIATFAPGQPITYQIMVTLENESAER